MTSRRKGRSSKHGAEKKGRRWKRRQKPDKNPKDWTRWGWKNMEHMDEVWIANYKKRDSWKKDKMEITRNTQADRKKEKKRTVKRMENRRKKTKSEDSAYTKNG